MAGEGESKACTLSNPLVGLYRRASSGRRTTTLSWEIAGGLGTEESAERETSVGYSAVESSPQSIFSRGTALCHLDLSSHSTGSSQISSLISAKPFWFQHFERHHSKTWMGAVVVVGKLGFLCSTHTTAKFPVSVPTGAILPPQLHPASLLISHEDCYKFTTTCGLGCPYLSSKTNKQRKTSREKADLVPLLH